jgi:murein DD-endopeptidase MepM/ murein hydrolase activator NlpD
MQLKTHLQACLARLCRSVAVSARSSSLLTVAVGASVLSLGIAEAASRVERLGGLRRQVPAAIAALTSGPALGAIALQARVTVWEGIDLDGDGQADVANPTGHAPRDADAYGEGRFHARRDGGERLHEGVDYIAVAGQAVEAPISGYVSRIGYAYPDDQTLRYVEIDNPALHLSARVFYVDPKVAVGDAVAVGHPIGNAHTLQRRYPGGITDHVHVEIEDGRGRKLDAERLILARSSIGSLSAD